jgi:molecular chaperone Hsp33
MDDYLVRVIAREAGIRGFASLTTALGREGARRHDASPLSAAALSYGLTGAALLGALLKVQQRGAIKVQGNGPLGQMVTESDSYGHVRGYVSVSDLPSPVNIGPEQVAFAIGDQGLLTVAKDLRIKDVYRGVVELQSGHMDEELMHYLRRSEQTPSLVEIGARMSSVGELRVAGGLLLQPLPGGDPGALERLSQRADDLPPLADLLADGETPEKILRMIFGPMNYEVLEKRPISFRCSCSWERSKKALMLLGRDEVESLMAEGEAVVECHFCHERYYYGVEALETILDEMIE